MIHRVFIDTDALLAATALLEQINTAARAGNLEPCDCSISIELIFVSESEQDAAPLTAVIDRQLNALGVKCSIENFDDGKALKEGRVSR
jgi:hypothetical protein